jgi:hypothetical protein
MQFARIKIVNVLNLGRRGLIEPSEAQKSLVRMRGGFLLKLNFDIFKHRFFRIEKNES